MAKKAVMSSESTAPKGPPKHVPKRKPTHPIEVSFAADPFDPRFVEGSADRRLTPLGMMVQTFWYLRQRLMEVCPDQVKFLESMDEQQPPAA